MNTNHTNLVKYTSQEDSSYQIVVQILKGISLELFLNPPATQEPPPPVAGQPAPDEVKRIDFTGYVRALRGSTIDRVATCSVSLLQTFSPTAIFKFPTFEPPKEEDTQQPQGTVAMTQAQPDPIYWVHIPLNNTAWVNVGSHTQAQDIKELKCLLTIFAAMLAKHCEGPNGRSAHHRE